MGDTRHRTTGLSGSSVLSRLSKNHDGVHQKMGTSPSCIATGTKAFLTPWGGRDFSPPVLDGAHRGFLSNGICVRDALIENEFPELA